MKTAITLLLGLSFSAACAENVYATETNEQRSSTQILQDPSPAIARRVSIIGRLQWSHEDKSLYPTWAGTPAPRGYCLPVLVSQQDDPTAKRAEELTGQNVRIYGIISFVAPNADSISVNTCKQLGIHIISIEAIGEI